MNNQVATRGRSRGKIRLIMLAATAGTVLAACGSSASATSKSVSSTSQASLAPYVMHAIVSETGSGSFLGSEEAKSLQTLAKQVNASGGIDGHPLQMDIKDNQSSPATAVSLATSLISSGVPFLLNGSIVAADKAVDALATANGPFIYDLSPGVHPAAGSMIFSSGLSTTDQVEAGLSFLQSKGLTNIAAMTSTDATGADGLAQLKKALALPQFSSIHLLTEQTFDPGAVSVDAQMSVIKADNPQALIIWTTGTPFGTVLSAMSSLGMKSLPTLTTDGNAQYPELIHLKSTMVNTLYFPTPVFYLPQSDITNPAIKAQVAALHTAVASTGDKVNTSWGLSWGPAQLLIAAVKKIGVSATAKQIQSYMENLHNVPSVWGFYNTSVSDHRGLSMSDIHMTDWNGSSFVSVSSAGSPSSAG